MKNPPNKNCVTIPPLGMVDDILTLTKCGTEANKVNAIVQSFVENKRLTLGIDKCLKMHVGNVNSICPKIGINNNHMKNDHKQKYLGDALTSDLKIDENIKARKSKEITIVNNVISILKEIAFGKHIYEVAMTLRNSLLINGTL